MKHYTTQTFKQTRKVGYDFAKMMTHGCVITLSGELGAGKTTFMQGFAKGLGISRDILSPTFLIMRSYTISSHPNITSLYHVDLYRVGSEQEIIDLGLVELMQDPTVIVAIEWPDKLGSLMPHDAIAIDIVPKGNDEREIVIKK